MSTIGGSPAPPSSKARATPSRKSFCITTSPKPRNESWNAPAVIHIFFAEPGSQLLFLQQDDQGDSQEQNHEQQVQGQVVCKQRYTQALEPYFDVSRITDLRVDAPGYQLPRKTAR